MTIFAKAQSAPTPGSNTVLIISFLLAAALIGMSVAQLFTYEDFPEVLSGYWLLGGQANAHIFAALIVTAEVFALPFLLRLRVSPLMRVFSWVCGVVGSLFWLTLGIWALVQQNALTSGGLLGATIPTSPGLWQVLFALVLLVSYMYVGWSERRVIVMRSRQ